MKPLRKSEATKYKIYSAIMEALPRCKTMNDLEERVQQQGIDIHTSTTGRPWKSRE